MSAEPEAVERPPARVWLRVLLAVGALALIVAAFAVANWASQREAANKLRAIVARLDAEDAGWRIDDIEAARADPPAGENSTEVTVAAAKLVPAYWPYWETDPAYKEKKFDGLPANHLLDAERAKMLADEMAKMAPALARASRLAAGLPAGKYKTRPGANPMYTLLPDHNALRLSGALLRYGAWDLARKGDTKGALIACRASINAGRSLGDEPYAISLLLRVACVSGGLSGIERTLALGEAADADLAEVQNLLRLEDQHPTLLIVMRGQRAMYHAVHEDVTAGKLSAAEAFSEPGTTPAPAPSWWSGRLGMVGVNVPRQHLLTLELFNDMVEAASLPPRGQIAAEKAVEARVAALPKGDDFVKKLLPALTRLTASFRRKVSSVRAMDALIAVERYRLKYGRWPEKLENVPEELLPSVPLDPYDGAPVRYRRTADGVVVYTLGENLKDDGGAVERMAGGLHLDLGYRLWDVNKRRQPPEAKPAGGAGM